MNERTWMKGRLLSWNTRKDGGKEEVGEWKIIIIE